MRFKVTPPVAYTYPCFLIAVIIARKLIYAPDKNAEMPNAALLFARTPKQLIGIRTDFDTLLKKIFETEGLRRAAITIN